MKNANMSTAQNYGQAYAKAEALQAQNDADVSAILAGLDFTAYGAFRDDFKAGATAAGYAAPDMLWSRLLKRLTEFYGFNAPKSPKAESQQKAESRKTAKEKQDAIKSEVAGKTEQEILLVAAEAIMSGDAEKAKILTNVAVSAQKDAEKAAAKLTRDALASVRDAIIAKVKEYAKAGDMAKLEYILESCGETAKRAEKLKTRKAA